MITAAELRMLGWYCAERRADESWLCLGLIRCQDDLPRSIYRHSGLFWWIGDRFVVERMTWCGLGSNGKYFVWAILREATPAESASALAEMLQR